MLMIGANLLFKTVYTETKTNRFRRTVITGWGVRFSPNSCSVLVPNWVPSKSINNNYNNIDNL